MNRAWIERLVMLDGVTAGPTTADGLAKLTREEKPTRAMGSHRPGVVPMPPSTNNLFATVRGKRVRSRQYKAWIEECQPIIARMPKPESLPVRLVVTVTGKVRKSRDLDNMLKPIGDLLVAAGLIPNDNVRYVTGWSVDYLESKGGPEATIQIEPVGRTPPSPDRASKVLR